MDTSARSNEAWERVLAAVEADTARAAALLEPDPADLAQPDPASSAHDTSIPATWRLPSSPDPTLVALPDPKDMPPIPEELRERIERLRDRIESLQKDLARALAEAARTAPRAVRIPTHQPAPGYVDRRL